MEAIINTVSTIFKERYGAQLKIEKTVTASERQPRFVRGWQSPFVYSRTHKQVSFPIFNGKKELRAIVTASPVENQDAIIFDEMAQFLQLTVAEHIDLSDQLEAQFETQVAIERAHVDQSKVVELKTRKKNLSPTHFTYKDPVPKKEADLRPIWISGANENFNAHIAFSIHDWVSNWAFINAKEIPDLVWQDPHAWQNFPQVTLFIPNIASLSDKKIAILKENWAQLKKSKGPKPLIVITSPEEVSPELEEFKREFKYYKSNEKISARIQAHFLLYHHKKETPGIHECEETNGIYFLPFSPGPTNLH